MSQNILQSPGRLIYWSLPLQESQITVWPRWESPLRFSCKNHRSGWWVDTKHHQPVCLYQNGQWACWAHTEGKHKNLLSYQRRQVSQYLLTVIQTATGHLTQGLTVRLSPKKRLGKTRTRKTHESAKTTVTSKKQSLDWGAFIHSSWSISLRQWVWLGETKQTNWNCAIQCRREKNRCKVFFVDLGFNENIVQNWSLRVITCADVSKLLRGSVPHHLDSCLVVVQAVVLSGLLYAPSDTLPMPFWTPTAAVSPEELTCKNWPLLRRRLDHFREVSLELLVFRF